MAFDPKHVLQRTAATPSGALPMDAVLGRATQLRRRRRGTVIACVAVLLVAGSLAVAAEWPERSIPPSHLDESPSPEHESVQRFPVSGGAPSRMAVGAGSAWAANTTGPGWTVTRFDESTGEIQAEITLPGYTRSVTFGEGYLWALIERGEGARAVTVVDPDTNEVLTTSAPLFDSNVTESHDSIAVGDGSGWVAFRGRLYRIDLDPDSRETAVTESDLPKPFKPGDRDSGAYAIAFGGGSVWVGKGNGAVARVDPSTGAVVGPVKHLDWNLIDLEAGSRSMWIVHTTPIGRHRLLTLDYVTGEVTESDVDLGKYGQYWLPRLGGSSLWLLRAAPDQNLVEMDEPGGTEIHRRRLRVSSFFGAAASDTALWIATRTKGKGEVIRVPSHR